ncbi:MAG: Ig domain-containing protein [Bryobacteraceae bacterium]
MLSRQVIPLFALILLFSVEAFAQFRLVAGGQTITQVAFDNPTGPLTSRFYVLEATSGPAIDFIATASTASGGNWLSVIVYPSETTSGTTGNSLEIRVNPNLPLGSYSGTVLFQQRGNPTVQLTIPVSLAFTIYASPSTINLTQVFGSPAPTQTVTLSTYNGNPFTYTAQVTSGVTLASITSKTPGSATVHVVFLTFNSGLTPLSNPYTGNLRITIPGMPEAIDIPISLRVVSSYTVTPTAINLNSGYTSSSALITPLDISAPYTYSTQSITSTGEGWLSVEPTPPTAPVTGAQSLLIRANPTGLTVGRTYIGTVRVILPNQFQDIAVSFTPWGPPGGPITGYSITPTSVNLAGSNTSQLVTIAQTTATGAFFYATSVFTNSGGSWLSVYPQSSASFVAGTQQFTILANPNGLSPGVTYTGTVRIFLGEQVRDIPVAFTPAAQPLLLTTTSLNGGIATTPYSQALQATAGLTPYTWTQSGLPGGLTLDPATGAITGTTDKPGTYQATITVRDSAQQSVTTTLPLVIQPAPSQTPKLSFVPLTPCRLMETRSEYNFEGRTGAFGPPFLGANETRTLTLSASNVCQIPATAAAYVLNVTVIPRGPLDFVTVFPGDESRPEFRTVSSPDGQIVANSTIVRAGTGGAIKVFASANTDLLIDISGYFTSAATPAALTYYPITPCRAIETRTDYRSPAGPFGPPALNTREARRFRLPESPHCSLPSTASAYSATVTVVPQGPLAYLTAWPSGGPQPNVSSINSFQGRVLANHIIVPAGLQGAIDIFAFNRTDLIVDITGYFAPDDGAKGLYYFPLVQCRIANTESPAYTDAFGPPQIANETTRTIPVTNSTQCLAIPAAAKAYALNVTALPAGSPMPFLTVSPSGQSRPNASMLNAFEGQTVTNSSIVPAGAGGSIDLFAYRRTHVAVEISGYFAR